MPLGAPHFRGDLSRRGCGHPWDGVLTRSCDAQLAFRAALTSGFVRTYKNDVKNVPGFSKKRAKPLAPQSSHLGVF